MHCQVFFAVLIGAFALGQAGPYMEGLVTAAGSATTIFNTIDRVSVCVGGVVCVWCVYIHVAAVLIALTIAKCVLFFIIN